MAHVITYEIEQLIDQFGLSNSGFLTLTFPNRVCSMKEAQRRFHSVCTNVLKQRYLRAIVVSERHLSGGIHFHLFVILRADIRSGFDFDAFGAAMKEYGVGGRSPKFRELTKAYVQGATQALRDEWAFWRRASGRYGFGRHEVLPIRSTGAAVACYMGKYVGKCIGNRRPQDKGARLVRFVGFSSKDAAGNRFSTRKANARFAWANDNAWLWRQKVAIFAHQAGAKTMEDLQRLFGPRWAYHFQASIMEIRIDQVCPSERAARIEMNLREKTQLRVNLAENKAKENGKVYDKTFQLNPAVKFEPVARVTYSDRFGDLDPIGDMAQVATVR
jgi:hypothetical protein